MLPSQTTAPPPWPAAPAAAPVTGATDAPTIQHALVNAGLGYNAAVSVARDLARAMHAPDTSPAPRGDRAVQARQARLEEYVARLAALQQVSVTARPPPPPTHIPPCRAPTSSPERDALPHQPTCPAAASFPAASAARASSQPAGRQVFAAGMPQPPPPTHGLPLRCHRFVRRCLAARASPGCCKRSSGCWAGCLKG
jgi:hypothetical protein